MTGGMEYFKKASIYQLDEICGLYDACKQELLKNQIYQWGDWGDNYPGKEFIMKSITAGELFIMQIDKHIAGAVVLNRKQSPEWDAITWRGRDERALVIHALIIDPKQQNKGLGKKLLKYCETYAGQNNYRNIRLDAFSKNDISNRMYLKYGYKNMGTVLFDSKPEHNKEYYCYEKLL